MFALETWMKKAAPHVVSAGIVAFGVWILIAGLRSSAPVLWICVALIPVVTRLLSAFGYRQTLIVWITGRQSATQQDKLPPLDASIRHRSKSIASVAYGRLGGDPCRPGHGPRWSGGGNCAACCEHRTAPHAKHERGRPPERRSARRDRGETSLRGSVSDIKCSREEGTYLFRVIAIRQFSPLRFALLSYASLAQRLGISLSHRAGGPLRRVPLLDPTHAASVAYNPLP